MPIEHSWTWLAPRHSPQQLRAAARDVADSRPCLPTIEALGDRVLFSVVTNALGDGSVTPAPTDPTGILIGLLKGELSDDNALIKGELGLLKVAVDNAVVKHIGNLKYNDFHALTGDMTKVNAVLSKFAEDVLDGGLLPAVQKARADLGAALLKLQVDGNVVDGGAEKSPVDDAFLKIESASIKLLEGITPAPNYAGQNKLFAHIVDAFDGSNAGLLKLEEDVVLQKGRVGDDVYLKIKLTDILISSLFVGDKQTQGILIGLLRTSLQVRDDVLHGSGGDQGGGVTTPSLNGDLLT